MRYIFVDLEMQPVDRSLKDIRRECRNEIIEIGAVMLDDNYEEIASYKSFVRPSYSKKISPYITRLTGITDTQMLFASDLQSVLYDFLLWCMATGDEYIVYAWSDNDYKQVMSELEVKQIVVTDEMRVMLSKWVDYQEIFMKEVGLDNPISLEKAINTIGDTFEGKMHDALYDARNTSILYKDAHNTEKLNSILNYMRYYLNKEETESTLEDLIDFDSLVLQIA